MASDTIPAVAELPIHSTTADVPKYPNCYPSINPIDKYRVHIAELVADTLQLNPEHVYTKLQWTTTLEKGDLVLAVSFLAPRDPV
jgi:arginyl-tRNA synthetase